MRRVHVEVRTSSLEDQGFLAIRGPPRRRGWTRLGKLVRLDLERGLSGDSFYGEKEEAEEEEEE